MMFKKILIANRGEIAVRVAHACHELGIATVGVYSSIDKQSLHLRYMDEAVCIGDAQPNASYLNIPNIIDAVHKTKAHAVHPGYGFLAENALFAEACENEGVAFIGPDSKALTLVGDKVASRNTVRRVQVPIIPGMEAKGATLSQFKKMAEDVGYPVIVKASMGGGGKGMRIVRDEKVLSESIAAGQREAKSAFGDDTVYMEKYIERPRHIEFQVIRDQHGTVIHLCERECSIQRRHQKIIEETPSPVLTPELRHTMGEAAKKVMEAADYVNAGTVEFLLDAEGNFYFLEVNARVQVEHPITELVTGFDIVRNQILIAAGEKIPLSQHEVVQNGHAIEARIYAEDPENNFLPCPGKILYLHEPQGPGVRVDTGIYEGWTIPPHYDPILSKLITWGEKRQVSITRMSNALKKYVILGIKTNIGFLRRIMETQTFGSGDYHTHFIDENETTLLPDHACIDAAIIAAALESLRTEKNYVSKEPTDFSSVGATTPWQELGQWEICSR
jgi:acetyl-CoA carboxylase biotin carboxylase subunit